MSRKRLKNHVHRAMNQRLMGNKKSKKGLADISKKKDSADSSKKKEDSKKKE